MKGLLFILFVLLLALPQWSASVVVRQDKNGNLTISNEHATPRRGRGKATRTYRDKSGVTLISSTLSRVPPRYLPKIRTLSRQYGVDRDLIVAVMRAESGFDRLAVSKKGAVGLMQLMEGTARMYGVVDRYNADQNMEAGVRHLKYLSKKYHGNLKLVLAAYNAGEEAVRKYSGVPPYKETKTYIKRVMRFMNKGYSNYFDTKLGNKIYQYRTKGGKIVITDTYPTRAKGVVTLMK